MSGLSRAERFKQRLGCYRQRHEEQEKKQLERNLLCADTARFNLFCKEIVHEDNSNNQETCEDKTIKVKASSSNSPESVYNHNNNIINNVHKPATALFKKQSYRRVDRLQLRMDRYRVRQKEQEKRQLLRDEAEEDTTGYNLFCREINSVENNQPKHLHRSFQIGNSFDWLYQGSEEIVLNRFVEEHVCFLCGVVFSSREHLISHAEHQHFYDELAQTLGLQNWGSCNNLLAFKCPHCVVSFVNWDSFKVHLVKEHGLLNMWMKSRGFTI